MTEDSREDTLQRVDKLLWELAASYLKDGDAAKGHRRTVVRMADDVLYLQDNPPDPTKISRLEQLRIDGPASHSPQDWGKWIVVQLGAAVEDGIPENAGDEDFLYNFWEECMPWAEELYRQVIDSMEAQPEFPMLRMAFKRRFGVDVWEQDPDAPPEER